MTTEEVVSKMTKNIEDLTHKGQILYTSNAQGIKIPIAINKVQNDYTRKDGVRLITFWKRFYFGGYCAAKGFTLKKRYIAIYPDGKIEYGETRKETLRITP